TNLHFHFTRLTAISLVFFIFRLKKIKMGILNDEYVRELGVKFMKEKQNRSFLLLNALVIGVFGGLFFSLLHLGFHYFSITRVSHKQVLQFLKIDFHWIGKWYGYIFFVLLISLLSILLCV